MYKPSHANWAVAKRHAKATSVGRIQLPENFQPGYNDEITGTETRLADILAAPINNDYPVKEGDTVILYEVDQQLIDTYEKGIVQIPLEKVFGIYAEGQVRPIGRNVFLDWEVKEEISEGGIILPETHTTQKAVEAKVLAIGEKVESVKVGDQVLVNRFAGLKVKFGEVKGMLIDAEVLYALC